MIGVNTLLHIMSALALAFLYRQYSDVKFILETHQEMEHLVSGSEESTKTVVYHHQGNALNLETPEEFVSGLSIEGSSVYCTGADHTIRMCHFQNLCYMPNEAGLKFAFFRSSKSTIEGVPDNRSDPALLDLTSVNDHNKQYFDYVEIPASKASDILQDVKIIEEPSLMFKRFNPANIMHVFHDDLLPMHHTLRLITLGKPLGIRGRYNVQLVFVDNLESGEFSHLYELFTEYKPLNKHHFDNQKKPVCFKDVHVGISKTPTWYQYGFFEPQGPIPNSNSTGFHVLSFAKYVKEHLKISEEFSDSGHKVKLETTGDIAVIFTRKHNRVILNEIDLTATLAQRLKVKVIPVSLETHSVAEIISVLRSAKYLLGMHGSLLILSMFLPRGSLIVELFPYAVNPEHYTPYKTLATLPGMWISYKSWRNLDKSKTVTYPENDWEVGGIKQLSEEQQKRIMESSEVTPHLCCKDPEWLFRIYQDTEIDLESVISIIEGHNSETSTKQDASTSTHYRLAPSKVEDIQCDNSRNTNLDIMLSLRFDEPFNLKYLSYEKVQYEVWTQEKETDNINAWILSNKGHDFTSELKPNTEYLVWVRCILDEKTKGPFGSQPTYCTTSGM